MHLVDEVLPHCAYRQWTLAFPRSLKVALASDSALLSAAVRCFGVGIFALQRRQARRLGIEQPRPGAIAFVQMFSSASLLHPHTHVLRCLRPCRERQGRGGGTAAGAVTFG